MAGPIRIAILASAANAVKAFKDTSDAAGTMGSKLEAASSKMSKFTGPSVAALGGLGAGLFKAGQDAAELGDSVDASRIILGDAQQQVEAFSNSAAKNFGISKQQATDAANAIGNFGSKAGLSGDALGKFTTDTLARAGDAASMFGGTAQEAVDAFGSALRGEFEPIRKYGVLLDDNTVKAQALKMGLISSTKDALTPQQKTLAVQASILEQTAKAQGNFAQTADSAKNKQETLKAELANVSAELGTQLLPLMSKAAGALSDMVTWASENKSIVSGLAIAVGTLAAGVLLVSGAIKVWQAATAAYTAVQWLLNIAMTANPVGLIILAIVALIAVIVLIATKTTWFQTAWKVTWDAVKSVASATWSWLKDVFAGGVDYLVRVWDYLAGIPDRLLGIGKNIMRGLSDGISAGLQWIKDKITGLGSLIPDWLKSVLGIRSPSRVMAGLGRNIMAGLGKGISDQLPALKRQLGTVSATLTSGLSASPSVDLSSTGRVALEPASSGRTYVLNVNVPVGADLAETGRQIVRAVEAHERQSGRTRLVAAL